MSTFTTVVIMLNNHMLCDTNMNLRKLGNPLWPVSPPLFPS